VDTGNTSWVLVSTALVLLMTPGLALFYGGMVRAKSVLNMMMMSFGALALVLVLWALVGYSLAFGNDVGGVYGDPADFAGLGGLLGSTGDGPFAASHLVGSVPAVVFVAFQATFAGITVALISGAIADRARFGPWLVFAGAWLVLVYSPVAHWVFAADGLTARTGGWLTNGLHVVDFAGGTVVEVNAGAAGLALALVLGKRRGFGRDPMRPHNLTLVMAGAGLLWFGWLGFNAGSALGANEQAAEVLMTTLLAMAAATLSWLATEHFRDGHATSLGAASGMVAGGVAITPSCASVTPLGALLVGAVAGAVCALAVGLKYRWGYDDSLDVVGVHFVGGVWGTLAIGLLASPAASAGARGLLYGGGLDQLWRQAVAVVVVAAWSFLISVTIGWLLQRTWGFRVTPEDEMAGIDSVVHAETAYDLDALGGGHPILPRGQAAAEARLPGGGHR
jgi:Amt family ammonium transporter